MATRYRHQWYQKIYEAIPAIRKEAARAGERLGIAALNRDLGLYTGSSSRPGNLPDFVLDAIVEANAGSRTATVRSIEDRIRETVKDVYGDGYDAAVANTCEAGLRITLQTLCAPPAMRHGDTYRARVVMPYAEDYESIGGYGRAFPPRYKNLLVDRTVAGGELGVEAKSLPNLETVYVRMAGGRYECHGVRSNPTPLLTGVDADGTLDHLARAAERHAPWLAGIAAIGYDTPSYGHGVKDANGTPALLKGMAPIARTFDVPYIVDTGGSIPFVGIDPREVGCDVITYSMDKPGRAPASGLIIGREESMNPIRKGMGLGGQRYGEVSSHGKAVFTFADPGRDALVGLLAYLRMLRDDPERITGPIDRFHEIVVSAFEDLEPAWTARDLIFTKTYQLGGTEVNYERTWHGHERGIPIFTLEDLWANTNPFVCAQEAMGIEPATIYAGKCFLSPGLGTLDREGALMEDYARVVAQALVESFTIVCRHAGLEPD